jgi:hypothetical protein
VSSLNSVSISVNLFWCGLDKNFYQRKDLYGNKDLLEAKEAEVLVSTAVQKVKQLPEPYQKFYRDRLAEKVIS